MQTAIEPPQIQMGQIKTLGPLGPKYQVGQPLRQQDDGHWLIQITLIESGEKTPYRLDRMLADPEAY